ncbi:MAG TPA: glycosyltransferase family 4 protein [Verrucomicrobiae bacterium]|jgi:glycosyltransferase involved in cell wall biosynthesis
MTEKDNFKPQVSVLTAGRDRHYTLGLANALVAAGINFDFIASDELEAPELLHSPQVRFLNLRGDQSVGAGLLNKIFRVLAYYLRLIVYAATSRAKVFHILWNNKFEFFDRTLLMLYYKMLGKKIVFTAHNVNAGARDGCDSFANRFSLKFQYRLCDGIFVHTQKMKAELVSDFGVPPGKVVLIPFGLNQEVPDTAMTPGEARERLGLRAEDKVILFFGNIAPYKGLQFLIEAFTNIAKKDPKARLVIAGRPKGPPEYWQEIRQQIECSQWFDRVIQKIEYIPDADTEIFFKAADVLVLPYVHIFQSGVLSLAFSFGLPVIAADVGSLKEEIIAGKTGLVFEPGNSAQLARAIRDHFQSDLYTGLAAHRTEIQAMANEKYSWAKVAAITVETYSGPGRNKKFPSSEAMHHENSQPDFAGQKL